MTKWMNTLDLTDVWDKAKEGKISIQDLAKVIFYRLPRITNGLDGDLELERDFLRDDFEDLSENPEVTTEEFNELFDSLYDWGDTYLGENRKVCWIATIF